MLGEAMRKKGKWMEGSLGVSGKNHQGVKDHPKTFLPETNHDGKKKPPASGHKKRKNQGSLLVEKVVQRQLR